MPPEPNPADAALDLAVIAHLRGFPEDLERYANLVKHAHPKGKSAVALIIHRPGSGFLRRLCELVASGEDVVTTAEAARLLRTTPQQLLERLDRGEVPVPEFRDGAKVIWRREVWEEHLRDGRGPA
ncbi:MAG: hypothetical protein K6U07_10015 [Firmicutes bacterium]|nr:hypothetical protein [Bacillota bacterium]